MSLSPASDGSSSAPRFGSPRSAASATSWPTNSTEMKRLVLRLYLGFLVVLLVAVAATSALLFNDLRDNAIDKVDRVVVFSTQRITSEIAEAPDDPALIRRLAAEFGFPIAVIDREAVQLSPEDRQRLRRSGRAVTLRGREFWAYTTLPNSQKLVAFGPLPELRPEGGGRGTLGLVIILLTLALGVGLLVRPLARQLSVLSTTARDFGSGALGARTPVLTSDAAGTLAQTFNAMAARIEHLVKAQQELFHAVSHELRTPLARVRYGLELLRDVSDPEERNARITRVDGDIALLNSLVSELLTYARLGHGGQALKRTDIDLAKLCNEIAETSSSAAATQGIEIQVSAVGSRVVADRQI
ncbi:MAG TPA: HAMP domain-containing protein, partial [Nannocystis exedens]|nr:HAMP domain-containing protein [Nannocystis exedens]